MSNWLWCYMFLSSTFISCNQDKINESGNSKMKELLSCKSTFVMEDGESSTGYYTDRESFISPYISKEIVSDTLKVSTVFEVNACGSYKGDIRFSNDTLYLLIKRESGNSCTSVEFYKFSYTIKKQGIENYNIVY